MTAKESDRGEVFVLGNDTWVGQHLCASFVAEGISFRAMKGPGSGSTHLNSACFEGLHTVFHLPVCSSGDPGQQPGTLLEDTRTALRCALEAGVERFIMLSSVTAMGTGNPQKLPVAPMDEAWPYTPQSALGLALVEAEHLVHASGIRHTVALRPVKTFGSPCHGPFARLLQAIQELGRMPITAGDSRHSLIHVADVVDFLIRATRFPSASGQSLIVAGPDVLSFDEIQEGLACSLGKDADRSVLDRASSRHWLKLSSMWSSTQAARYRLLMEWEGSDWYAGTAAEQALQYQACQRWSDWLSSLGVGEGSRGAGDKAAI